VDERGNVVGVVTRQTQRESGAGHECSSAPPPEKVAISETQFNLETTIVPTLLD
jgi:hypothetical protein